MTGLEDSGLGGVHGRKLVNIETDSVAGAVTEVITVACIADDRATCVIDLAGFDPGPDRSHTRRLRPGHEAVDFDCGLVGRFGSTDHKGSGHVAAVPVDKTTNVDHDQVSALHDAIGRAGVR